MDTTERITLRFDRLTDGTLVAVHQGVAAIVHPWASSPVTERRWCLAGDGFDHAGRNRPHGATSSATLSAAHAAEALGVHLGVTVDGYEIAP